MKKLTLAILIGTLFTGSVMASDAITVTRDNYAKAESQKMFEMNVKRSGGVNQFYHYDGIPSLEEHAQIVRSNNDTVYSTIVVDKSKGATITLPETGDRYISILEVDGNHFAKDMQYAAGVKEIRGTTDHVFVIVRIGVKDGSKEDLAEIANIQKQLKVSANSSKPVPHINYDLNSHKEIHHNLQAEFAKMGGDYNGLFGEESEVDKHLHPLGAATGWGGADMVDNVYQMAKNFTSMTCHEVTFEDPKAKYFWSITVYNKEIKVFSENAHVSSVTALPNKDGTYTVRFGCEGQPNNIDIDNPTGEWSPLMRHYGASEAVLKGKVQPLLNIKEVK